MCRPGKSMPRSRPPRASSGSIWSPMAATNRTSARSAHRDSRICRRWTFSRAGTCSPTSRQFSARSTLSSVRSTDEPLAKTCVHFLDPVMAPRRLAPVEIQPKSFAFSAENLKWAKVELGKYPHGRQESAILALLWRAQAQAGGWLPEAAIRHVANFLGMAHIRALEVATFYTMFNLQPVGKFHVQLCGTTPCRLRGADDLEKVCRKRIGDQGELTKDGKLSWIEVECLGACVNAPMAQINYDYYEDLTAESFGKILDNLAAGKKVKPGPQIDRQLSAPVGGATTLKEK